MIPTLFLDWAYGTFRPALRKDLERSARNDIEGPVFPYPHLKANLISSESRLHVVGASKNEVVEHECEILRRVLCSREPRAFCAARSRGREDTAVLVQPSSREAGAIRILRRGGKEPTVSAMRLSSRGPRLLCTRGSGGKEYVKTMVSTMRLYSRGPGAIRAPGSRG